MTDLDPPKLNLPDSKPSSRTPWLIGIGVVALAIAAVIYFWGSKPDTMDPHQAGQSAKAAKPAASAKAGSPGAAQSAAGGEGKTPAPPAPSARGKIIGVQPGQAADQTAEQEQAKRKKPYGVKKSLDAVLRSDEAIKVGGKVISIEELERKLVVEQRGKLLDKPLGKPEQVSVWGVYVVRPGENLWDIHFRLLREYLKSRGVPISPKADRPTPQGYSTGVGKVLKFAEHMVGVYNLKTGAMSTNLNQLEAGSKVVVYNLTEIFEQLSKIDPKNLSGIMYDGRVLFFPESDGQGGS